MEVKEKVRKEIYFRFTLDIEVMFAIYIVKLIHLNFTGCLWAMNPSKVGKMDEEVQKWSRKDPQAIKKAMVYPGKFLNIQINISYTYLDQIF